MEKAVEVLNIAAEATQYIKEKLIQKGLSQSEAIAVIRAMEAAAAEWNAGLRISS